MVPPAFIALHCIALHCIAFHCIALHCIHFIQHSFFFVRKVIINMTYFSNALTPFECRYFNTYLWFCFHATNRFVLKWHEKSAEFYCLTLKSRFQILAQTKITSIRSQWFRLFHIFYNWISCRIDQCKLVISKDGSMSKTGYKN